MIMNPAFSSQIAHSNCTLYNSHDCFLCAVNILLYTYTCRVHACLQDGQTGYLWTSTTVGKAKTEADEGDFVFHMPVSSL
jgi:hypothetical protein